MTSDRIEGNTAEAEAKSPGRSERLSREMPGLVLKEEEIIFKRALNDYQILKYCLSNGFMWGMGR